MTNEKIENNVQTEAEKKEKKKMPGILKFFIVLVIIAAIAALGLFIANEAGAFAKPESNYTETNSTSSSYTGSSYDYYDSDYDSYDYDSDMEYGAGGYEMPNENDDSFADYVQRVDPDLYDAMEDNYNDAVDDYYDSDYDSYDYDSDVEYGAGGYEMPNENDDSFADYVQRVDPDLYDAMEDNYYDALY